MNVHSYYVSDDGEPHRQRTREILKKFPEVKTLFGHEPVTACYIVSLVLIQILVAVALQGSSFWVIFLFSYLFGAFVNHALFVMIHEATHNLVFRSNAANQWIGIVANLPIIFPCMISFKKFHLIHHRYQGELSLDADLPGPKEAAWVGTSRVKKALWFLFFFVVEGMIRPMRVQSVKILDSWTIVNVLIEITFLGTLTVLFGGSALLYVSLSSFFCIGLHPLGARWIQEHYVFQPPQETYSYYGILNKLCFNVGYHNEHHDMVRVPWFKLPKLRAMAPEFYDSLYSHTSWTKLLFRFIWDRKITLFARVTRKSASSVAEPAAEKSFLEVATHQGLS